LRAQAAAKRRAQVLKQQELAEAAKKLRPAGGAPPKPWVPRVGERVVVKKGMKPGRVVALGRNGVLTVQVGAFRVTATVADLQRG
jgi:dsDNA-specific endonuclease/ATPase MutS2